MDYLDKETLRPCPNHGLHGRHRYAHACVRKRDFSATALEEFEDRMAAIATRCVYVLQKYASKHVVVYRIDANAWAHLLELQDIVIGSKDILCANYHDMAYPCPVNTGHVFPLQFWNNYALPFVPGDAKWVTLAGNRPRKRRTAPVQARFAQKAPKPRKRRPAPA